MLFFKMRVRSFVRYFAGVLLHAIFDPSCSFICCFFGTCHCVLMYKTMTSIIGEHLVGVTGFEV